MLTVLQSFDAYFTNNVCITLYAKTSLLCFSDRQTEKKFEQKIKDLKGNRRKLGSCNVKHVLLVCWSEIDCNKKHVSYSVSRRFDTRVPTFSWFR